MAKYLKTKIKEALFTAVYYQANINTNKAIIVVIDDEDDGLMNKACAKWLCNDLKINTLCIGIKQDHKFKGLNEWPLEIIEAAINYLKANQISKIGIVGMSMQSSIALKSATLFKDLSLVLAFSPNDFISWGFKQGRLGKYNNAEWPTYQSSLSYQSKPLAYHSIDLDAEAYYQMYLDAKAKYHEMHSIDIFEYSEKVLPIKEEAFVDLENAKAQIILIAAKDDSMWDASRYSKRLEKRLSDHDYQYGFKVLSYEYGTHLLMPESIYKYAIPIFYDRVTDIYVSGKKHHQECIDARMDLERKLNDLLTKW